MKRLEENLHKGHRQRMFEKAKNGCTFQTHELLEMFLYCTNTQKNTNPVAHRLLRQFGSLKGVLGASFEELINVDGVGERSANYIKLLQQLFKRGLTEEYYATKLKTPQAVVEFLQQLFAFETTEKFYAICLDANFNLISLIEISGESSKSGAAVNTGNALKKICAAQAKEVFITHNHLQDSVFPTPEDISTTKVLMQKLLNSGIILRDHIIINNKEFLSFAQQGWLKIWAEKILQPTEANTFYGDNTKIASGGVKLPGGDFGLII